MAATPSSEWSTSAQVVFSTHDSCGNGLRLYESQFLNHACGSIVVTCPKYFNVACCLYGWSTIVIIILLDCRIILHWNSKVLPGTWHDQHLPAEDNDHACGPRIYTFFLYLSDVEEGGETQFVCNMRWWVVKNDAIQSLMVLYQLATCDESQKSKFPKSIQNPEISWHLQKSPDISEASFGHTVHWSIVVVKQALPPLEHLGEATWTEARLVQGIVHMSSRRISGWLKP